VELRQLTKNSSKLYAPKRTRPGAKNLLWITTAAVWPSQDHDLSMIAAIRSAAWPSQSSGTLPLTQFPARTSATAARIRAGLRPTRTFVPAEIVTGRSVFSRTVRHGTPRNVVYSWMPPESVMTTLARIWSARKSKYGKGSISLSRSPFTRSSFASANL
jgi:hypothetical protein